MLSPQTAQIRKNDYIKMLESLQHYEISLGTDPNSRTIRNEAFRIEMLKRGWTPEDMPFMEAYFDSIENCTDPEVAQIGLHDWLKKQEGYEEFTKHVNFELIQRDPVPGPDVWDHRRNYPDLRNIPNLKATTIYTTVADATLSGLFFRPQRRPA